MFYKFTLNALTPTKSFGNYLNVSEIMKYQKNSNCKIIGAFN